jgi:hypothetical protein
VEHFARSPPRTRMWPLTKWTRYSVHAADGGRTRPGDHAHDSAWKSNSRAQRTENAAELNAELHAISTFRQQMSPRFSIESPPRPSSKLNDDAWPFNSTLKITATPPSCHLRRHRPHHLLLSRPIPQRPANTPQSPRASMSQILETKNQRPLVSSTLSQSQQWLRRRSSSTV